MSVIFGKMLKKKVEFEIIKAQLPFQDSNILCQILGYNANNYKFRQMLKILIPRAVIKNPSKELNGIPFLNKPVSLALASTFTPNEETVLISDAKTRKARLSKEVMETG